MGNKKRYQTQLRVQMKYAPAPDADARLSRAIDILLRSWARDAARLEKSTNVKKTQPPGQVPTKDTFTGGGEDSDRQGS